MATAMPLRAALAAAGATFGNARGTEVALEFGDAAGEYHTAREHAAVIDRSASGKIEVSGPDAASFLHNLCTNDVKGLMPGSGCEAFLTSAQAKVLGHALIFRVACERGTEGAFWLDLAPGQADKVLRHLDRHLISEQATLSDRSSDLVQLHVCGPDASRRIDHVFYVQPALSPAPNVTLFEIEGAGVQVRRTDSFGLPGFDLLADLATGVRLWQRLVAAGVRPAGARPAEILRVEAGRPLYGIDIDDTNLPQEAGRTEQAISFTKGCYIGQETVARIRTYGHVNRSLVGVRLSGPSAAEPGSHVLREGAEVGLVTSSVLSPKVGCPVALAYVKRGCERPGTRLQVQASGVRRDAEVATLPFVP